MNSRTQRSLGWAGIAAGAAAIALGCLWVYWPALRGTWLWDDGLEVANNSVLRAPGGWWQPWVAPVGMDYFPLKSSLQWLEWRLWGGHETGYHVANLGLHVLGALLLWRLFAKLFDGGSPVGPWCGAFLFAVHPMAVESVAWISEFKNVLSLPPLLLAATAWIEGDRAGWGTAGRSSYVQALAWFLVAMLCKTSPVLFPAALLLCAWWRHGRVSWADVRRTTPFFSISLGLGAATLWFQKERAIGIGGPMPPLGSRLAQAGWNLFVYLRESVWPVGLSPVYLPVSTRWPAAIPWVFLAAGFATLWHFRRERWSRHALFGLGWFFLNLLPVLGILPISYLRVAPRADHLAYLSLIGIAGLAGAVASLGFLPALSTAAACIVLALGSRAYANIFASPLSLWTEAVGRSPGSWLASNNLGQELLRRGRADEAARLFEAAAAQGPPSAEVHANLGSAYQRTGRIAAARAQYEEAVRIDPGFAGGHFNLGQLLLAGGQPSLAADQFRAALRIDPSSASCHNDFGVALARQGQLREALAEYRAALQLDPGLADAWVNVGNALYRSDRANEAIQAYREALQVDPQNAAARQNLAAVEQRVGR